MKKLTLKRIAKKADYTIGRLEDEAGNRICYKGGELKVPRKSAVPEGTYPVVVTKSWKFGKYLPLLVGVPGFEGIRIHSGNTNKDTDGCILVGQNLEKGKVLMSRITLERLMKLIENEKRVFLTIE